MFVLHKCMTKLSVVVSLVLSPFFSLQQTSAAELHDYQHIVQSNSQSKDVSKQLFIFIHHLGQKHLLNKSNGTFFYNEITLPKSNCK